MTTQPVGGGRRPPALPVLETEPARRGPDRALDRRLTFAGLVAAIAFLAAAGASLALPAEARLGSWLPLHLLLAGAAGTAITAMVPFFVAALAVAPPAPAWLHGGAIALVASGAALIAAGRVADPGVPAGAPVLGAAAFVAGAAAAGIAAVLPLRRAAGTRRPATELAYVAGLAFVCAGGSLAGLYLAGTPEVLQAWPRLRVAHAWLNLFGFLALIVAGTLLHLAPTIAGSRIRGRPSGRVALAGLGLGVAIGVAGYLVADDLLARAGATLLVAGAAALAWHGVRVQRDAVGWRTELDWHRFAGWSMLGAPAWLLVTTILVWARVLGAGSGGAGWRLDDAAPLVLGFAVQVLLGALAHLVPAIGPGSHDDHARARRILGRLGSARVVAWNVGVAAVTIGSVVGAPLVAGAGGVVLGAAGALALGTLLAAVVRR